jgi:hypothetical protein
VDWVTNPVQRGVNKKPATTKRDGICNPVSEVHVKKSKIRNGNKGEDGVTKPCLTKDSLVKNSYAAVTKSFITVLVPLFSKEISNLFPSALKTFP